MGRRLKKEGICVYVELVHVIIPQKLLQYHKAIIFQFKKFKNDASSMTSSQIFSEKQF